MLNEIAMQQANMIVAERNDPAKEQSLGFGAEQRGKERTSAAAWNQAQSGAAEKVGFRF